MHSRRSAESAQPAEEYLRNSHRWRPRSAALDSSKAVRLIETSLTWFAKSSLTWVTSPPAWKQWNLRTSCARERSRAEDGCHPCTQASGRRLAWGIALVG